MKHIVKTVEAPAAIGPYSQAVRIGELIFCSGQIPLVPETGEVVQGDVEAQARQVLKNLQAVIEAAGASLDGVVKTTVFLTDLEDFNRVNGVYREFFAESLPARTTVQVTRLPKEVKVEIEAIAYVSTDF